MKFWPVSEISRCVSPAHAAELQNFCYRMPSRDAYNAAISAIRYSHHIDAPNLVVIESVGAPGRRVYTDYPRGLEWFRLERTTIMDDGNCTFILMDALH